MLKNNLKTIILSIVIGATVLSGCSKQTNVAQTKVTPTKTVEQVKIEKMSTYNQVILGKWYGGNFNKDIIGMIDSLHVKRIQRALNQMAQKNGFENMSVTPDGYYGIATENAVKEFQKIYDDVKGANLKIDGIIHEDTWNALVSCYKK